MNIIILACSLYLIGIATLMKTNDFLSGLFFKAVPMLLGIMLGIHAAKNFGFVF